MPLEGDLLLLILRRLVEVERRPSALQVHGRLVFDGHFDLVAVFGEDVAELAFEILFAENLADVAVGKHGVGTVRFADRLEQEPAAEEALGIRRRGRRGHGYQVLVKLGRGVGIDLSPGGESRQDQRKS